MQERWAGRGSEEENQMAEKERAFWWVQFSCAFTSTHPRQTVPSGREFNLQGDQPSLKASFFGVCLPCKCSWLTCIRHLYGQCVLQPKNTLHFCLTGSSLPWCILTAMWKLHRDSSQWKIWSHSCFKFFLTFLKKMFWLLWAACGILVSWPGMEPTALSSGSTESGPLDRQGGPRRIDFKPVLLKCTLKWVDGFPHVPPVLKGCDSHLYSVSLSYSWNFKVEAHFVGPWGQCSDL